MRIPVFFLRHLDLFRGDPLNLSFHKTALIRNFRNSQMSAIKESNIFLITSLCSTTIMQKMPMEMHSVLKTSPMDMPLTNFSLLSMISASRIPSKTGVRMNPINVFILPPAVVVADSVRDLIREFYFISGNQEFFLLGDQYEYWKHHQSGIH